MTTRNTVHVLGENPETETQFILYGASFTPEQINVIESILSHAEQQILRYLRTQEAEQPSVTNTT